MFIHESVEFPTLKQHNLSIGRVYRVESGKDAGAVYPSITRILAARPKPALEAWKARLGRAEAAKQTARAGAQGANVHKLAECYLGNEELPSYGPNVTELWQHLHPWLHDNITAVIAQEQDVYSNKLQVGGRMDLLANVRVWDTIRSDIRGELAVVDIKTAKQEKRLEWVRDYFLQGTFYACAVFELTGLRVKKIVLPITHPGGLQVVECKPTEYLDELRERIDEFYLTYEPSANTA
jgi:genome maintenance exonuclease 1